MAKVLFTAGRVSKFKCPAEKSQAFIWDSAAPGLGLRVTPAGKPAYVFQGVYSSKDIRLTIGSPDAWGLDQVRKKVRELQRQIDQGQDPRELKRKAIVEASIQAKARTQEKLTVGDVWPTYLKLGRPKRKDAWKPRYLADLKLMASAGGEKKKRGEGVKRTGPLYPLMSLPLAGINEDSLKSWFDQEALSGKHQATRALMMFRGFLRWCSGRREYRDLTDREAGRAPAIVESLPSTTKRTDALEAAQVEAWWRAAEQLDNFVASTFLRALLLTGARREELASLQWSNVDFRWRKLTIADKVELTRTIPLTPYLASMLKALPRTGPNVFASTGKSGHIADARASHAKVQKIAGIEGLTIHGLRRSFSLLGEAAGAPEGAIAQVMGHKPSATAEGYSPRSIDALRPFLTMIEAHILNQAGVKFVADMDFGKFKVVQVA